MRNLCFYFQVHQPWRFKNYRVFSIGKDHQYFNEGGENSLNNRDIFRKVADKCYLPANQVLLQSLKKNKNFQIAFSFSGVFLEQAKKFYPKVIASFKKLVKTGRVEILSETYYHSLACVFSEKEFIRQIRLHQNIIQEVFCYKPRIFRNTELIYNNRIAIIAEKLGFKGVLTEGADKVLQNRSPNFVYGVKDLKNLKLLLKNYRLSDDIAFRFSDKNWVGFPLTAKKFIQWVLEIPKEEKIVNLFLDYETFGEHQWKETGIFKFLEALLQIVEKEKFLSFKTPSQVLSDNKKREDLDIPFFISWADNERDLSAWLGNEMQQEAIKKLYDLEKIILKTQNKKLIEDWRRLQTSDHFYYMCTKWFNDGDVHKYFNPFRTPFEAFISFINILNDVKLRIESSILKNKYSKNK